MTLSATTPRPSTLAQNEPLAQATLPSGPGFRQVWGNLPPAADSWALANIIARHPEPILIICKSTSELERLQREAALFLPTATPLGDMPDWEVLPYDTFSPHQDIISGRLRALYDLQSAAPPPLLCSINTLLQRLPPPEFIQQRALRLAAGDALDPTEFIRQLSAAGYQTVPMVEQHGEVALRGGLIDVFPMGAEAPLRIELFDNSIDTIRVFDPETQRTRNIIAEFELLPGREFPLDEAATAQFRESFRAEFDVNPRHCPLYQDMSTGLTPAGIEFYLALFFDHLSTLFDHLPSNTLIVLQEGCLDQAEHFLADVTSRYENRRHDTTRPILAPARIYLRPEDLAQQLNRFPQLILSATPSVHRHALNAQFTAPPECAIDHRSSQPLAALQQLLKKDSGRILFCADSSGRRESLLDLLRDAKIQPTVFASIQDFWHSDTQLGITIAPLSNGMAHSNLLLLSETQLFGAQPVNPHTSRHEPANAFDDAVRSLAELKPGQPVVHLEHGVGRYEGLESITFDGTDNEFLALSYAGDTKLYVPVTDLHLISRYAAGEDVAAPLHSLGSDRWLTVRRKALEKIRDTAAEMLDVYARREAQTGFAFPTPDADYRRFAAEFAFSETPDQKTTIAAVIQDMTQLRPMDRLVCGDVGFGKTEVALRAAFIAAMAGKQVAVLVPTTLLAQQHRESFGDRFANWPIRIEVLSRLRTGKEANQVLKSMAEGSIDILIGTHKLLSKDLRFKDLGLLVVDEEHRFGVAHKEKIKALRANVDILSLTATPIPRTLNMALSSLRDLSVITTPPARRLSIKTFVREHDEALKKEAILREIQRGGQVFVLHNEVRDIELMARSIQELVPEARVTTGHGQMRERDLERVMTDFYHKRFNVLVCTTIIETGIDIPSANTIIIERADRFGLAQLHQLRGRVGRSHHQAYAYLLTPPWKSLTRDAQKRLEAITEAQELGSGFVLATHDLEIRGAGELLGEEQSGHIESIGFSLYLDLLERAVTSLQKGEVPDINLVAEQPIDINLHLPAHIPDPYLADISTRLTLYKRIASAPDAAGLRALKIEMIDRFGLLPEPLQNLFAMTQLRLRLAELGIVRLHCNHTGGMVAFASQTTIDPYIIVKLVQQKPAQYRLQPGDRLGFTQPSTSAEQRFSVVHEVLAALTQDQPA